MENQSSVQEVLNSGRKFDVLELVYTDLMGPAKTPSYSGMCYVMVLVLVDDWPSYTWVKFLKEKSKALSKFFEFKTDVGKSLGKKSNAYETTMAVNTCQKISSLL